MGTKLASEEDKISEEKKILLEVAEKAKLAIDQTSSTNDPADTAEMERYHGVLGRAEKMIIQKEQEEERILKDKQVAESILNDTILQIENAAQEAKSASDMIQAAEKAKEKLVINWKEARIAEKIKLEAERAEVRRLAAEKAAMEAKFVEEKRKASEIAKTQQIALQIAAEEA